MSDPIDRHRLHRRDRDPIGNLVDDIFAQVKDDILTGIADAAHRAAGRASRKTGKTVVGAGIAIGELGGALVILDRKVRLDVETEIAAIVGRRGHPDPEIGAAKIPAGRYRAVTIFIPED